MTSLVSLVLPILLSAVAIFIVSSIIHMLMPWHKGDYNKIPGEPAVLAALRGFAIPPGDYMAPKPSSMDDLKSPEFLEKRMRGPVLVMTVMPNGPVSMGGQLFGWFLYLIVVSAFAACIAGSALDATAPSADIFHYVALCAFAGYALALWQMSIWYKRAWLTTVKANVDALIYACITGGIFIWLWPR